jgi:hypothetical protein
MIFDHFSRFKIVSESQHLLKHDLSVFTYTHGALPGVSHIGSALDWFAAVLYPRTKAAVATPAALPLVGNTLLDFRVVTDDGDGKAAAYRWEQREGDIAAKWYKIHDMDWGIDSVLARFVSATQDLFPYKYGYDDLDSTGTAFTGVNAGQHIFGGASANTHLTLHANSGDGVGAQTGYIQAADHIRPTADGTYDIGSITGANYRFKDARLSGSLYAGTCVVASGSITDTSGAISFGDETLSTTGRVNASDVQATAAISALKSGSTIGLFSFTDTTVDHATGGVTIAFGKAISSATSVTGGDVKISGSTVTTGHASNNLALTTDGTGIVEAVKKLQASNGIDITNAKAITFLGTGGISLANLTIGVTERLINATGDLTLQSSTNLIFRGGHFLPYTDAASDLGVGGMTPYRFKDAYLSGALNSATATVGNYVIGATQITATNGIVDFNDDNIVTTGYIGNGALSITMATLLTLRNVAAGPPASGATLFWDGTKWEASLPDTEIDHGSIGGLSDDDHTQYIKGSGRTSGQTINGGADAGGNLTLDSTANVTKGNIIFSSILRPSADGTVDIGTAAFQVHDLFIAGELIGARLANHTTAERPAAAAGTKGRIIWDTDLLDMFIDGGGFWLKMSIDRWEYEDNTTWTGAATTVTYTVDGSDTPARGRVTDARTCLWQLKDNTNNHKIMSEATIDHPAANQVRITFDVAPPAGTYRLIGVG